MTLDKWVECLNSIGAELDSRCSALHPTAWQYDPGIEKLQRKWKSLVKQPIQLKLPGG